jgi:hypothetical protein
VQVAGHPDFALLRQIDHLLVAEGRELVFFGGGLERLDDPVGAEGGLSVHGCGVRDNWPAPRVPEMPLLLLSVAIG